MAVSRRGFMAAAATAPVLMRVVEALAQGPRRGVAALAADLVP